MNRYSIFCTAKQTKKALKLGAPIKNLPMHMYDEDDTPKFVHNNEWKIKVFSHRSTTEQMIGWLEEQGFYFHLNTVGCSVEIDFNCIYENHSMSRREATLAAIDAALDYLAKTMEKK